MDYYMGFYFKIGKLVMDGWSFDGGKWLVGDLLT
jgi:hypothetical protein